MMKSVAQLAMWALLSPVVLMLLYGGLALVSAILPVAGRAQSLTPGDPALFVCASLAHTDLVVPINDEASGWRTAFRAVASVARSDAYLAIGWGDLGFYRSTAQWSDLKVGLAVRALAGLGPTTLHVLAVTAPVDVSDCTRILVDRAGRRALSDFVLASAEDDASGSPRLIVSPQAGEAFYAAKGRYSPWLTCNVWASEALAAAGVPAASWAPFSFGVIWPLHLARGTAADGDGGG